MARAHPAAELRRPGRRASSWASSRCRFRSRWRWPWACRRWPVCTRRPSRGGRGHVRRLHASTSRAHGGTRADPRAYRAAHGAAALPIVGLHGGCPLIVLSALPAGRPHALHAGARGRGLHCRHRALDRVRPAQQLPRRAGHGPIARTLPREDMGHAPPSRQRGPDDTVWALATLAILIVWPRGATARAASRPAHRGGGGHRRRRGRSACDTPTILSRYGRCPRRSRSHRSRSSNPA